MWNNAATRCPLTCPSRFDVQRRLREGLEPGECDLPLPTNRLERAASLLELTWLELPEPFAPEAHVAHDAGTREHLQVFRDALPAQVGVRRELCDRERTARAEYSDELEARGVAQCR